MLSPFHCFIQAETYCILNITVQLTPQKVLTPEFPTVSRTLISVLSFTKWIIFVSILYSGFPRGITWDAGPESSVGSQSNGVN